MTASCLAFPSPQRVNKVTSYKWWKQENVRTERRHTHGASYIVDPLYPRIRPTIISEPMSRLPTDNLLEMTSSESQGSYMQSPRALENRSDGGFHYPQSSTSVRIPTTELPKANNGQHNCNRDISAAFNRLRTKIMLNADAHHQSWQCTPSAHRSKSQD